MQPHFEILPLRGIECLQLCLINIANYYNLPYRALFYDLFDMQILPSNSLTSINIYGGESDIIENLDNMLGIKLQQVSAVSFIDIIKYEPIFILQIPLSECFWVPTEFQSDGKHYIIAIQTNKKEVRFIDPMYNKSIIGLSKKFVKMNIQEMFILNKIERVLPDSRYMVRKAYAHLLQYNINVQFYKLFEQWNEFFITRKTFESSIEIQTIRFLDRSLGFILAGSRNLYSSFLQYLIEEINLKTLEGPMNMLSECSEAWCKARNVLHKFYIKNEIYKAQIALVEQFKKIQQFEFEIKSSLCAIWKLYLQA